MKKFLVTVCIIAAASVSAWQYRERIPYLSQFLPKTPQQADAADGSHPTAGDASQKSGDQKGSSKGRNRNGGPTLVKTVAAVKTTLPRDVTASGWADADDNTTIAAQEQGIVTKILASDGATVKQGDLIAELDARTAQATVDKDSAMVVRDKATLSEAETALARANDLLSSKAGTQQSYDQAKAARDTASATVEADKAALAADQVLLEHTDIRAPFDGRLGDIAVSPGAFLNAGSAIVTIAKYDPIYVKFHLQERDLRQLKLALAAGPVDVSTVPQSDKGKPRQGHISFYDNTVDPASGTILAKAKFENASGALWPGQSVNIVVHFNNNEQQVVVPTVAVSPGADGFFAFVVRDGKSQLTPVTVARANGGFSAITKGLSEGDHVIIEGQAQLVDQQPVKEQFDDKALNVASADHTANKTEILTAGTEE
ncbi:efflux RND transporter periplasmic adaptor subunit [Rhizobium sp. T1470]|uniref:efflux RND transporter periplasmic adaptor subunit n=1 Tax=unclassified Rhizobium TaxID=2613769 RepID=UPI001AAF6476|nr:efflux RND transporter periplasmic adaptor subunit [Rhizobium sp. T1473]MCA0801096.1 efflux RND transporter periplasmic adaptor subunit [Rhizobium sp. T1473]